MGKLALRCAVAEMQFMRPTATHISMFHNRNDDVLKELKTEPTLDKIYKY
jgi:hypothetical protein